MHYTEEQLAAFEKAISMFKGDVNDLLFKAWFSRLKLFTVTEEAIVIEAENSMVVEQLRARYFQTLSNVLGAYRTCRANHRSANSSNVIFPSSLYPVLN